MTYRFARRSLAIAATLLLAVPGAASAHRADRCAAIKAGHVPRGLTADQAAALSTACDTLSAAVSAADDAYLAATQPAADAYSSSRDSVSADLRTAAQTRRSACRPDPRAQTCADARAAYRATLESGRGLLRTAWRAYRDADRPAAATRRAGVRAAQAAFQQQLAQILHSA